MARKHRMAYLGMYHIVNRGVERRNVFLEDEDYELFMFLLKEMLTRFNITLHTYCLMTNHYHILLETQSENISDAIKYPTTPSISTKNTKEQDTSGREDSSPTTSMMMHIFGW